MARKYAKSTRKVPRTKRTYTRYRRYNRSAYRSLARRISAVSRRVAGEVCKYEITPKIFTNSTFTVGSTSSPIMRSPLTKITSGDPWIMPLNWIYNSVIGSAQSNVYVDGQQRVAGEQIIASVRNPLWYNTLGPTTDTLPNQISDLLGDPGLQYRIKYIYINALFNASTSTTENTDGALRIVIVKDKQPTGGSATWADLNKTENSRGVFNSNRIDAQLNPNTVGRFTILYDKTLRFNTINGYKPFKYYKQLSTVVRNNRGFINIQSDSAYNNLNNETNIIQSSSSSPPVQKNAFYLMIFSDGLDFNYTDESETAPGTFHLFNRVAYFNN